MFESKTFLYMNLQALWSFCLPLFVHHGSVSWGVCTACVSVCDVWIISEGASPAGCVWEGNWMTRGMKGGHTLLHPLHLFNVLFCTCIL